MKNEPQHPTITFYHILTDIFALQQELLQLVSDDNLDMNTDKNIGDEIVEATKAKVAGIFYKLCAMQDLVSLDELSNGDKLNDNEL